MIALRPGEIVVDSFAGGGGASTGIEWALRRPIDVAINHDPVAVAMHKANHPSTQHYCKSVWDADPRDVASGRPVGLAWFSPDCKHFSKAKGGTPVQKNIRDLAWVVTEWARLVGPRVIMLENVEEFIEWCPLRQKRDKRGRPLFDAAGEPVMEPDPARKGETFRAWVAKLRLHGYAVEWRFLRACDYGAPTIRKRLFVIARRDGQPIVWPEPTRYDPARHAAHQPEARGKSPYRTAAECIDWSIPCPSIFMTKEEARAYYKATGIRIKRPLVEATLARIGHGTWRFVIRAARPFIVPVTHAGDLRSNSIDEPLRTQTTAHRGEHAVVVPTLVGCGGRAGQSRPRGGDEPLATQTAKADTCLVAAQLMVNTSGHSGGAAGEPLHTLTTGNHHALVAASMVQTGYGERAGQAPRALDIGNPIGTQVAGAAKHAVVAAFLAQHNGGAVGRAGDDPLSTLTMRGTQQQLVTSHLVKLKGTSRDGQRVDEPMHTVTAGGRHFAEVRAFLVKYYSAARHGQRLDEPMHTQTVKARLGLVTVHGVDYRIADIGMRMLTPRERFRAQGFPDSYIIDATVDGRPLTETEQGALCGNSVCPDVAQALVAANFQERAQQRRAAE